MKKQFIYKEQIFNMELTLNTEVERTPGGKRIHTIKVSMPNTKYYAEYGVPDNNIKIAYDVIERHCKEYIDADIPDATTLAFTALGFE